ncbi:MAG: TetR family transcriptional regulator [Thermoleophilia bacterium]|nr:TetR family transcriptional regulator [Thermoleophilia bacterium]
MATTTKRRGPRMSAADRRESILAAATRVFSRGSYSAATTASIAKEAGITEPVLYHHFKGKAALYGACLVEAWVSLKARWEAVLEGEPDARLWLPKIAEVGFAALEDENDAARLWLYALTDLAEDPKARPHVIAFTQDVHGYIASMLERAQKAGGIAQDLDPRAEAWIFLSIGIIRSMSRRLDGIVDADFPAILAARQAWYARG